MMSGERAVELLARPDFPFEPTVKRAILHLLGRIEALEKEVEACRSKTSSPSEPSSEKIPAGTETESLKPVRRTGSRSKKSTGGITAGPGTS